MLVIDFEARQINAVRRQDHADSAFIQPIAALAFNTNAIITRQHQQATGCNAVAGRSDDNWLIAGEYTQHKATAPANHIGNFIRLIAHDFKVKPRAHGGTTTGQDNDIGIGFGLVQCRVQRRHHIEAQRVGLAVIEGNHGKTVSYCAACEFNHSSSPNLVAF